MDLHENKPPTSLVSEQLLKFGNAFPMTIVQIKEWIDIFTSIGVVALQNALRDENPQVREYAAQAVGVLNHAAIEAIPDLINAVSDKQCSVREKSIAALGRMGPGAASATRVLAKALLDKEPSVRRYAAAALGEIGPAAIAAVSALIIAMSDPDDYVREFAIQALNDIMRIGKRSHLKIVSSDKTIKD